MKKTKNDEVCFLANPNTRSLLINIIKGNKTDVGPKWMPNYIVSFKYEILEAVSLRAVWSIWVEK